MFKSIMELTAKICVMPLTELAFYKNDYIQKLSKIKDIEEYNRNFRSFLFDIYPLLLRTNKISNLDQINLLFDKFFPRKDILKNSGNITNLYLKHLSKLSKTFITVRRGRLAFKYWKTEGEEELIGPYSDINKVALWNSLNRIFTTDLLVIIYLLDNGYEDERYLYEYYSSIMLEDTQLEEVLKRGVAETHIHRGAAISFYISWQNCMNLNGKKVTDFKEVYFANNIIKRDISIKNIFSIAICRLVMAKYILEYEAGRFANFNELLIKYQLVLDKVSCIIKSIRNGEEVTYTEEELIEIWDDLNLEYSLVTGLEDEDNEKRKKDILEQVFGKQCTSIKTPVENIFLFRCIKYIRENNNDKIFSKIFIQYIRIKNEVFQVKVQNNQIKGLINFQQYSSRSVKLINSQLEYTDKTYWELLILNQLQNKHLKKLELRAIIPSKDFKKEIRTIVISFLESYKEIIEKYYINVNEDKCPLVGLVFSMGKKADDTEPEKCWQNFYEDEVEELDFMGQRSSYMKQLHELKELRQSASGLSNYIVGIDAASVENNTEPWVFGPVYDKFRDSKCDKHLYLKDDKINVQRGLGFTFHVGEDFRHLLTGLRRIDEVIESFKFHAGDRIGHGIALGLDVYKWSDNNKIVILPRIEYLENLLWIWGIYKNGKYDKFFDVAYLEQKIMEQAEYIYRILDGITIYSLWKAYKNKFKDVNINDEFRYKHSSDCSKTLEYSINNKVLCIHTPKELGQFWNEDKLTHAQHCKCYLERMIEPFQVLIEKAEIEMIKEVQKLICRKVSTKGIIVETNPTSNATIGEVESIFEHYIHSLNKRGLVHDIEPESSVMVSINSDDPSVFNTNVSNEFAYIFYSLQEKGYSREDILLWIDKIRKYGMDSSFIEDRHMQPHEIIVEIDKILEELNPKLHI